MSNHFMAFRCATGDGNSLSANFYDGGMASFQLVSPEAGMISFVIEDTDEERLREELNRRFEERSKESNPNG